MNETVPPARGGKVIDAGAAFEVTPQAVQTTDRAFEVTPQAIAQRIAVRHADRILVVLPGLGAASGWPSGKQLAKDGERCAYWLEDDGRWNSTGDPWRTLVDQDLDEIEVAARTAGIVGKAYLAVTNEIRRGKRSRSLPESVRLSMRGDLPDAVTFCKASDLDVDLRYLGCANGVVDLHEGRLLGPADGRETLTTFTTGVEFDPDATHPDVERMFAHLPADAGRWFVDALGHSLHGRPSRRLYIVTGPKRGGKTTVRRAIRGALGDYAAMPPASALVAKLEAGAHTAGLEKWGLPARIAVLDEPAKPTQHRVRYSTEVMKALSGEGEIAIRRLHENASEVEVTGTTFIFANTGKVPQFDLEDEAMADRVRELPYPEVPNRDRQFRERIKSREFRRAFLAMLVRHAAAITPGEPPTPPALVERATAERIREDGGDLVEFARRVVTGGASQTLTVPEIWAAWAEWHEADEGERFVGGVAKSGMTRRLRTLVEALPAPKSVRQDGKTRRGWKGWRLAEAEEARPKDDAGDIDQDLLRRFMEGIRTGQPADIMPADWPAEWREHAVSVSLRGPTPVFYRPASVRYQDRKSTRSAFGGEAETICHSRAWTLHCAAAGDLRRECRYLAEHPDRQRVGKLLGYGHVEADYRKGLYLPECLDDVVAKLTEAGAADDELAAEKVLISVTAGLLRDMEREASQTRIAD